MDLGLAGKRAIVCAASRGLGRACAAALAAEGADLLINARDPAALAEAAAAIRAGTGARVDVVAADIATEQGQRAVIDAAGAPDILVTNCGGPSAGDFRDWQRDDWIAALDALMLAPIAL